MKEKDKFKHQIIRTGMGGQKLIQSFAFNNFVAAKIECDRLNVKASEFNPKLKFKVITKEVK